MITFRKATPGDLDALLALYDHVFSAEEAGLTSIGWKRGIYPTRQTLAEALARDDLFLEEADGALVGAAVFNKLQSDYYAPAPWQIDARPNEVMVMHTFAIDPTFRRQGYARAMLDFYERHAREEGCRALRIDTNERNSGALALYASFGFQRITIHPHCFEGLPEIRLQLLEKVLASQSIKEHSAMTVTFRKATAADLDAVSAIYDRIHTEEEAGRTTIGWVRDIYPTRATAEAALARDDLYVELQNDAIVGTAILNHLQGDEYTDAPWQIAADGDHVLIMHTLVIDPTAKGHGLGTAFAQFYERTAREQGCTALRIDTNARNIPARTLYKKLGYREVTIVPCQFNGIDGVELVLLEKAVE